MKSKRIQRSQIAPSPVAPEIEPMHVFDQTNGVIASTRDEPQPGDAEHAARNGFTVGGVTNLGTGGMGF